MPTIQFDDAATRRAMRLSVIEAVCFAINVSFGEAYFIADGVRLGASGGQVGLLVALPLGVGAIVATAVPGWIRRFGRRKPIVLTGVAVQILVLMALALAEVFDRASFHLLITLACLYQACGQSAGVAWGSWYGDVVPAGVRGRYFARRSRTAHLAMLFSFIGAGATLQALEPASAGAVAAGAGGLGYATVFGVAVLARTACFVLLARSPEPHASDIPATRAVLRRLAVPEMFPVRRVIAAACLVQLAVAIGSAYFNPFMLDVLELSYVEYTAGTMTVMALKFVTLGAWGRAIDRVGARSVYVMAAACIALVPIPWLFAQGVGLVIVGQALSGVGWGGYEVSSFSLILESIDARTRPVLLALINAFNGTATLTGAMIGRAVLTSSADDYRLVFVVTTVARMTVALGIMALLPMRERGLRERARELRVRMFAWSPMNGPMYRPTPDDEEP